MQTQRMTIVGDELNRSNDCKRRRGKERQLRGDECVWKILVQIRMPSTWFAEGIIRDELGGLTPSKCSNEVENGDDDGGDGRGGRGMLDGIVAEELYRSAFNQAIVVDKVLMNIACFFNASTYGPSCTPILMITCQRKAIVSHRLCTRSYTPACKTSHVPQHIVETKKRRDENA